MVWYLLEVVDLIERIQALSMNGVRLWDNEGG